MSKNIIVGLMILIIVLLTSNVLADTVRLTDTEIDYVPYREIVIEDPGLVFQIKIINLGTTERDYEIIPDVELIKEIGTYKISPSDYITLEAGTEETVYFYLDVEKKTSSRVEVPLTIKSGNSEASVNLVARNIGPVSKQAENDSVYVILKNAIITIIIILIIIALTLVVAKRMKGKKQKKDDDEFETYY